VSVVKIHYLWEKIFPGKSVLRNKTVITGYVDFIAIRRIYSGINKNKWIHVFLIIFIFVFVYHLKRKFQSLLEKKMSCTIYC
jgi:hypothetical protein